MEGYILHTFGKVQKLNEKFCLKIPVFEIDLYRNNMEDLISSVVQAFKYKFRDEIGCDVYIVLTGDTQLDIVLKKKE